MASVAQVQILYMTYHIFLFFGMLPEISYLIFPFSPSFPFIFIFFYLLPLSWLQCCVGSLGGGYCWHTSFAQLNSL